MLMVRREVIHIYVALSTIKIKFSPFKISLSLSLSLFHLLFYFFLMEEFVKSRRTFSVSTKTFIRKRELPLTKLAVKAIIRMLHFTNLLTSRVIKSSLIAAIMNKLCFAWLHKHGTLYF